MNHERCTAVDATAPGTMMCFKRGNHAQHDDGRGHIWENLAYVPPAPRVDKGRAEQIAGSAKEDPSEKPTHEPPPGPRRKARARARRTDPVTSHEAADKASYRLTDKQLDLYVLLKSKHGHDGLWTLEQAEHEAFEHDPELWKKDQSVRTRVSELIEMGLVERVPEKTLNTDGNRVHQHRIARPHPAPTSEPAGGLRDFG